MDTFRASDRVEQACAVIAARLDLDPETAAELLCGVAQRTGLSTDELAADVLASSMSSQVSGPRDLYTNDHDYEPAA
jgi:ANTAR domain-containing protein